MINDLATQVCRTQSLQHLCLMVSGSSAGITALASSSPIAATTNHIPASCIDLEWRRNVSELLTKLLLSDPDYSDPQSPSSTASPAALFSTVDVTQDSSDQPLASWKEDRLLLATALYLARMSTEPTPFGFVESSCFSPSREFFSQADSISLFQLQPIEIRVDQAKGALATFAIAPVAALRLLLPVLVVVAVYPSSLHHPELVTVSCDRATSSASRSFAAVYAAMGALSALSSR